MTNFDTTRNSGEFRQIVANIFANFSKCRQNTSIAINRQKLANISANFNENFEIRERASMRTVQRSALCRSRRELSNEEVKRAAPGRRQKAPSGDKETQKTKKASVAPKEK